MPRAAFPGAATEAPQVGSFPLAPTTNRWTTRPGRRRPAARAPSAPPPAKPGPRSTASGRVPHVAHDAVGQEAPMLVLTRKPNEEVVFPASETAVRVLGVRGGAVR